jgi:putative membrane protein
MAMRNSAGDVWKGAAAGLAAGLAATWVMTQFQELSGKLEKRLKEEEDDHSRAPQHSAKRGKEESAEQGEQGDDATVKAADKLSRALFHHRLTKQEKKTAGPAMHYGFGALTGAAYGALAELAPAVTWGAGVPFGTAVWLAADEISVPVFGLSRPPWEYPPSVHARALGAHLVYGLATEGARRLARRLL